MKISGMSGKVVIEKSETMESGRRSIKVDTEKLIRGTYMVEAKHDHTASSQKLLISK